MEEYVKKLDFDSDTFSDMKRDMNFVLQRLLGNMVDSETTEASMTLKIDIKLAQEYIPNYDPDVEGESRMASKPQFKHKVTSAIKINDEKSGNLDNEMELVFDKTTGVYEMRPIANTTQRSIFDSDFEMQQPDEKCVNDADGENNPKGVDGSIPFSLPGPVVEDGEYREVAEPIEETTDQEEETTADGEPEGLEDITEQLMGDEEDNEAPDDYDYDEPEGE